MTWFNATRHDGTAFCRLLSDVGCLGLGAQDFIAAVGDAETIDLQIDSQGGDASCGAALCEFFKGRNVSVLVTGDCWSAAMLAALGAGKVQAYPDARVLIHQPVNHVVGTAEELRSAGDSLYSLVRVLTRELRRRTGQSAETIREWISKDTYLTAQQALDARLIDEIIPRPKLVAPMPQADLETAGDDGSEALFLDWLHAFGNVTVKDRERFMHGLGAWAAQHVKQF